MQKNFNSTKLRGFTIDGLMILIGSFLFCIVIHCFTDPNNISPGGVVGIGQLVKDFTGFHIGTFCLLVNFPIFIWGFLELHWKGLIKNLACTFTLNIMINLTAPFLSNYAYTGNMLLVAVISGLIAGLGLGLMLWRGAATGGTDFLAMLTKLHIPHMPVGKILLLFDGAVVLISAIMYSTRSSNPYAILEGAAYAAIHIFIVTKIIDAVVFSLSGGSGKLLFVSSKKGEEISRKLTAKLGRGTNIINASHHTEPGEAKLILAALKKSETGGAYDEIQAIDRDALVFLTGAHDITGPDFNGFPMELERPPLAKLKEKRDAKKRSL